MADKSKDKPEPKKVLLKAFKVKPASEEQQRRAFETHQKTIDISNTAANLSYKYLTLVAGAAVIALLAFLGQVISNNTKTEMMDISVMIPSLYFFGFATICGAICPMIGNFFMEVSLVYEATGAKHLKTWKIILKRGQDVILIFGWVLFIVGLIIGGEALKGIVAA